MSLNMVGKKRSIYEKIWKKSSPCKERQEQRSSNRNNLKVIEKKEEYKLCWTLKQ